MAAPFGVNAWFEAGDSLEFRPVRVESHAEYLLTFDISAAPYGSVADLYGSWFSGALDNLAYESQEDGQPRVVTIEIEQNDEFEVIGYTAVSVAIEPERWRSAAAQSDDLSDDIWIQAMYPDFVLPADVSRGGDSPLLVARFRFRVRTKELSDHPGLRVNVYEGSGDEAHQIDGTGLTIADQGLMLVWGMEQAAMEPEEDDRTVTVFYATDRVDTESAKPWERYSGDRGELVVGTLEVNIPKGHEEGEIERPIFGWHRLEDPEKHMILMSICPLLEQVFYGQLTDAVSTTNRKEAFVFIHGYNVTFEAAALRTGQMAYDFQRLGLDAVPVLFSWPSAGKTTGYVADLDASEWSAAHLADFLTELRHRSGADVIHLIAHSMGNRVLTKALQRLAAPPSVEARFNQVVLAAPDIDVDVFRQAAGEIRDAADRMTLYANSGDKALDTSEALRMGRHRAGDVDDGRIVVVDGVDSIDASDLDTGFMGHSYFAEERLMIRDLTRVMADTAPPGDRPWLRQQSSGTDVWWAFADD